MIKDTKQFPICKSAINKIYNEFLVCTHNSLCIHYLKSSPAGETIFAISLAIYHLDTTNFRSKSGGGVVSASAFKRCTKSRETRSGSNERIFEYFLLNKPHQFLSKISFFSRVYCLIKSFALKNIWFYLKLIESHHIFKYSVLLLQVVSSSQTKCISFFNLYIYLLFWIWRRNQSIFRNMIGAVL